MMRMFGDMIPDEVEALLRCPECNSKLHIYGSAQWD